MNGNLRAAPVVLLGGVLLGYANSFLGDFQFDDYNVIVHNPSVRSLAAWFSGLPAGIRPLLKLTYALNWISGLGLFGFHMFNMAVHAANTLFVHALSRRLLGTGGGTDGSPQAAGALAAALLFAVHPVQTEAVTYVSGRSVSLMSFFYLASLWSYVRWSETGSRVRLRLESPLLFLLALSVRETAVSLPVALLLWEWARPGPRRRLKDVAREQAAHWAILACAAVVFLVHPVYRHILESRSFSVSWGLFLPRTVHGVFYLLSRLFLPHRLNIDPDLSIPPDGFPTVAAETAALAFLLVFGVRAIKKYPPAGFGILWFFLHLAPTNSLVPRQDVANERHMYLACWGIFLCAGWGVGRLEAGGIPRWRWVPAAASAILILAMLTIVRNHAYRSEVALWESTVRLSPEKARVHNNLGYAYQISGKPEKAIESYREALRLDADHLLARGNLETLLREEGPAPSAKGRRSGEEGLPRLSPTAAPRR